MRLFCCIIISQGSQGISAPYTLTLPARSSVLYLWDRKVRKNPNPFPIWKIWFGLYVSGSPGRARTYNNSVNSRVLCHWATEDYGIRQRLILPGRVQPSTFSTGELNFCVRDGNRWNLSVIATGNGSYLIASPFSSCFPFSLSFCLLAFEREGSKLKGGETPLHPDNCTSNDSSDRSN